MSETAAAVKSSKLKGAALLRLIGIFKVAKAVFLVAGAISVFHLIHEDIAAVIIEWGKRFHIAPGNKYVEELVEKVLTVTHRQLIVLGVVLLVYAAMFLIEGIGLLMLKHWAEWMTVITTSGLIPLEVYEIYHKASWTKVIATAINVLVAVYLAGRVWREAREKKHRAGIRA
jgi:uncharacterized membrane protein (DUF2068 family)